MWAPSKPTLTLTLGMCAAVLMTATPAPAAGARPEAGTATVLVTMTNAKLELLPATVPAGTVVFKIVNKGTIARDFRLGVSGKRTPRIGAGKSATLTVSFGSGASILVLSYGAGGAHALSNALTVVSTCTNPVRSTVRVRMREAPPTFSPSTVRCGTVTFVVTNVGTIVHRFEITAPGNIGAILTARQSAGIEPGHSLSMTVHFTSKGSAYYYCAETEHTEIYGELGYLQVV